MVERSEEYFQGYREGFKDGYNAAVQDGAAPAVPGIPVNPIPKWPNSSDAATCWYCNRAFGETNGLPCGVNECPNNKNRIVYQNPLPGVAGS